MKSLKFLMLFVVISMTAYLNLLLSTKTERDFYIVIKKGASIGKIASDIRKNSDHSKNAFAAYARIRYLAYKKPLQAGEYLIKEGSYIKDILHLLESGDVVKRYVTIPEGLVAGQIYEILLSTYGLQSPITRQYSDGELLPETYRYAYGQTADELLLRMKKDMDEFIETQWEKRIPHPNIKTPNEAIILASIVEKEAKLASEQAVIASVFLNRLKLNMPLQADPTVLYAVSNFSNVLGRSLRKSDLAADSPFNTYRNIGLPPAAICNPGKASIIAVLQHIHTPYLYFVVDGTGGHSFSANYLEHVRNVHKRFKRKS